MRGYSVAIVVHPGKAWPVVQYGRDLRQSESSGRIVEGIVVLVEVLGAGDLEGGVMDSKRASESVELAGVARRWAQWWGDVEKGGDTIAAQT